MRNIAAPRLGDVCPFLELPPEIRNRIYEYALGGHNLHMFALDYFWSRPDWNVTRYNYTNSQYQTQDSFFFQYCICKCPGSDADQYEKSATPDEDVFAYNKSRYGSDKPRKSYDTIYYLKRHAACLRINQWFYRKTPFRERPTRLNMALLRTCKQVYNEACLVPYYENTFSFSSGKDLDVFVNAVLQPKQREALQHVQYTVDNRLMERDARGFSIGIEPEDVKKYIDTRILSGLQQSTVDMLVGLQSLDIAMEDHVYTFGFDENSPRFLNKNLSIRVVVRDGWNCFKRNRKAAIQSEFGLARSVVDVKDEHEASMQLSADSWGAVLRDCWYVLTPFWLRRW